MPRLDGLRLERYQPKHAQAVAALMRRLWSTDLALNARFFEWRYIESPGPEEPIVQLVTHEGRVVAMRALHSGLWEGGGMAAPVPVYQSDDLVVAREFEGRGLFAAFTEAMRAELDARGHRFFVSLSALQVTRRLSIARGAIPVGPFHPVGVRSTGARVLDFAETIAERLPYLWRHARRVSSAAPAADFFDRLDAIAPDAVQIGRVPRAQEMAALVASLPWDGRIRRRRDAPYLAWRYRNPLHEYRFAYAVRRGRLCGYLVVERARSDLANRRRAHIVEWEAESPEVQADLLREVVEKGQPAELVTWQESAGEMGSRILRESGFHPVDASHTARGAPGILVWPVRLPPEPAALRLAGRALDDLSNWDIRIADTSYG